MRTTFEPEKKLQRVAGRSTVIHCVRPSDRPELSLGPEDRRRIGVRTETADYRRSRAARRRRRRPRARSPKGPAVVR